VRLTQAQFEPIPISERLWIVPSWHEAPGLPAPSASSSTRASPSAPAAIRRRASACAGWRPVCAAVKASARLRLRLGHPGHRRRQARRGDPVLGIDIDPQAVEAARDNAERNAGRSEFGLPDDTAQRDRNLPGAGREHPHQPAQGAGADARRQSRGDPGPHRPVGHTRSVRRRMSSASTPYGSICASGQVDEGWVCLEGVRRC
jgi:ribosomal protein L11 methyltransferase